MKLCGHLIYLRARYLTEKYHSGILNIFQRKNTRKIFRDHSRLISLKTPYRYNCSTIRICVPGLFVHVECALRCNHSNKRRYSAERKQGRERNIVRNNMRKKIKSVVEAGMSRDEVIGNHWGFFQGTNANRYSFPTQFDSEVFTSPGNKTVLTQPNT